MQEYYKIIKIKRIETKVKNHMPNRQKHALLLQIRNLIYAEKEDIIQLLRLLCHKGIVLRN